MGDLRSLRRLFRTGVAPDHLQDFQRTPLYIAASPGELAVSRALLKQGADPNAMTHARHLLGLIEIRSA